MLYTIARSDPPWDRVVLYPSRSAAEELGRGGPVLGVAVRFEPRERRVVPLWVCPDAFDPSWSTPAEGLADGSVVARGPIPEPLFAEAAARGGGCR